MDLGNRITGFLYSNEIAVLGDAIREYVSHEKTSIWLLVDNLDKGWPVRGADTTDIVVVHSLMEASRKLQRSFDDAGIDLRCLVFLRTDIHEVPFECDTTQGKRHTHPAGPV